ncbi:MAG: hypothetical protein Q7J60_10325, partial [Bradyrhizobium sp.]|nr:hypothetical protein [Bradyrhizobium sp.]
MPDFLWILRPFRIAAVSLRQSVLPNSSCAGLSRASTSLKQGHENSVTPKTRMAGTSPAMT